MYGFSDVVAIDIGGTTTDIGQYLNGTVAENRRGSVEGISVSFPLCEIISSGVGGSSIFRVQEGRIVIGPESVGAVPGPACFGRGGKEATITDASLLCGILDPKSYFGGDLALDSERASAAVEHNIAKPLGLNLEEALHQMQHAYEEKVAVELHRSTSISKQTILLAFGGAGPLNACGVAEKAGINTVAVPKMAAVFSAYGIGQCDISQNYAVTIHEITESKLKEAIESLTKMASRDMYAEGYAEGHYELRTRLLAIVDGKEISHCVTDEKIPAPFKNADHVEVDLKAVKVLRTGKESQVKCNKGEKASSDSNRTLQTKGKGQIEVPVYNLNQMKSGNHGAGPAIIEEDFFTCRVLDGWDFVISDAGDILLNKRG
jgi:N-methylhydantoinase A/oxoprolinase/acetone carboxylase beta subunit